MKVLFVLPHLDDEVLSCGGLIQKLIAEGHELFVLTVFGRKYNYGTGDQHVKEEFDNYCDALTKLGVVTPHQFEFVNMEEGEPGKVGYYAVLRQVEKYMTYFKPDMMVIPSEKDLNQDHRFLNECCRIALRPANLGAVKRVLTAHAHDGGTPEGSNFYIEMTPEILQVKIEAMACYERESRPFPHPRSPEMLEAHARMVGSKCGLALAEPYTLFFQRE